MNNVNKRTIDLPDKIQSGMAVEFAKLLSESAGSDITIDARRVVSIGAFPAEILLRFKLFCEDSGCEFQIEVSSSLEDDLRMLGMTQELLEKGKKT